jgi:hypothetical protein
MKRLVVATALALIVVAPAAYADCDAHHAAAMSAKAPEQPATPAQTQAAKPQADKVAKTETPAPVKQVVKVKAQAQDPKVASSSTN